MQGSATQWLPVICHGTGGSGSSVTGRGSVYLCRRSLTMITSRRHVTKSHEAQYRLASRLLLKIGAVALGLVCAISSAAAAQSTTTLALDAATLPRGVVRLRVLSAWNRADALFGVPGRDGATPLGYGLNVDSLG